MIDLKDSKWALAIAHWIEGEPKFLEMKLLGADPLPPQARAFIVEALAGRVKRKRGRKPRYPPVSELAGKYLEAIEVNQVFQFALLLEQVKKNDVGTPTERALARCAERFGKTEDQISKIVFPRFKAAN